MLTPDPGNRLHDQHPYEVGKTLSKVLNTGRADCA
jgi:hypothetical protein